MTREQWTQVKALFADALEQPPETRAAWVRQACGDDAALRHEVQTLLDADANDPHFLTEPAVIDPADLVLPEPGPDESIALTPGTIVGGRYRVLGELGRGGMGIVYTAEDLRLPRRVAMKVLPAGALANPARLERFQREAWAAARISHPAVATIHAFEEFDDRPCIISEYVPGRTLRSVIADGPLSPARARRVATEMARALVAAHAAQVVHRDLKPENVILTESDGVKVVDFGIAQIDTAVSPLTQEGSWVGTPAYTAPEQQAGAPVDGRADVYSLGVVLSEMLTGHLPWTDRGRIGGAGAGAEAPVYGSDARAGAEAPAYVNHVPAAAVPAALSAIVHRCLQPNPSARYQSARDLLAELERLAGTGEHVASSGAPVWWWQFHQAAIALVYAVMIGLMWSVRADVRAAIGGTTGRVVALIILLAVLGGGMVGSLLRLNLWFQSRVLPDQLAAVRRRIQRWIRIVDWLFVTGLVSAGLLILEQKSYLALILIAGSIGVAVAAAVIEPVTARAAFDQNP